MYLYICKTRFNINMYQWYFDDVGLDEREQ